ncbi:MAG: Hsp20/alpha crystallin family protein [Caulobacteraceae bacterium]
MADPQTQTPKEQTEGREQAQGRAGAAPEPRSFEQGRGGQGRAQHGEGGQNAAQALADGGRQVVEQSRRAGRQMSDAWRQTMDPLLAMQFDISQWFDDVFRQTFGFRTAPSAHPLRPLAHLSAAGLLGLPPADLKETEGAHMLAIELPGLTKDDVDLSIVGDTLVVCGHKAEENDDASSTYRVSERRYGRFERAFPLPPDVERDRIEAQFRDGVLKIALPKNKEAAQPRSRIEIKT